MKLTLKQKQLIKEYAKKLVGNRSILKEEHYDNSEAVEYLRTAQDKLRDAAVDIRAAYKILRGQPSNVAEMLRSYILGHLEVLIDSDHEWMDRSTNIEEIINSIEEESESDDLDDEEE